MLEIRCGNGTQRDKRPHRRLSTLWYETHSNNKRVEQPPAVGGRDHDRWNRGGLMRISGNCMRMWHAGTTLDVVDVGSRRFFPTVDASFAADSGRLQLPGEAQLPQHSDNPCQFKHHPRPVNYIARPETASVTTAGMWFPQTSCSTNLAPTGTAACHVAAGNGPSDIENNPTIEIHGGNHSQEGACFKITLCLILSA